MLPLVTPHCADSLPWEQDTVTAWECWGEGATVAIIPRKHHCPKSPAATGEQHPRRPPALQ